MCRWAVLLWLSPFAWGQSSANGIAYFETHIRPLLAAKCYGCHSGKLDKPMGGLLVDSKAGMLRGGGSGAPAVVPGKPDESLVVAAIRQTNPNLKMPPGGKLDDGEIAAVVEWIRMGAPDPRDGPAPTPSTYDWEKVQQHWAFRPVTDPAPPRAASAEWRRSPVDAFIKAALDRQGLVPLPRASKLALIRRVTYDLIGLPPAAEAAEAVLKDSSP